MTLYVVSGNPRSGTSMMMGALIAGGMDAAYDRGLHGIRAASERQIAEYELTDWQMRQSNFPAAYDGRVVKVLTPYLVLLQRERRMQTIFMLRPAEERMASTEAAFGDPPLFFEDGQNQAFIDWLERRGEVYPFLFEDVLKKPVTTFALLMECGWPIDPEKAAGYVAPSRAKHRLVRL